MGKKYIIELEEPEMFDDRKFYTCSQMPWWALSENIVENLTPYTEPDLEQVRKEAYDNGYEDAEEKYNDGYSDGYDAGLIDTWEACKKIIDMDADTSEKIFGEWFTKEVVHAHTAAEAIEKLKAYEQEQETIQVGDEVAFHNDDRYYTVVVVTYIGDDGYVDVMDGKGTLYAHKNPKRCTKTGRNFPEIASVLEKMREGQE